MLGLVQAIARQTAAATPKDFVARFSERLQALSANQDVLVRNEWRGVAVVDLVRAQLSHFSDLLGTRINVTGPYVVLTTTAAQAIGLALHELATNAVKYGALSNAEGCVDLKWELQNESFSISWLERGGPPVAPPERTGFGSRVIGTMAGMSVGGTTDMDYTATGFVWHLSCPMENAIGDSFEVSHA
jgi:two-component sensor histidine kinase